MTRLRKKPGSGGQMHVCFSFTYGFTYVFMHLKRVHIIQIKMEFILVFKGLSVLAFPENQSNDLSIPSSMLV